MSNNFSGAICGGVVKRSEFMKDPMAYMMAYYMLDEHFEAYAAAKNNGKDKLAKQLFDKYAMSAI